MNETDSLKPISLYPFTPQTHTDASLERIQLKQLSLKMHHSLPPPFLHLYWLFLGCLLSFFPPPDSQYHPTRKRQQTLRMVELPPQHTQTANWGLEESQVLHHRGPKRTSKLGAFTTHFYEIWFFEAVALGKIVQNWANRSEVERAGQTLCNFLADSHVRLQLIGCVGHNTQIFGKEWQKGKLIEDKPY